MLKAFKKGELVQWRAGGKGGSHTIGGTVVRIVPAGEAPGKYAPVANGGIPRPHKSYLVEGPKGRIYWPRVSALKSKEAQAGAQPA